MGIPWATSSKADRGFLYDPNLGLVVATFYKVSE
jgi:hypothetical protein